MQSPLALLEGIERNAGRLAIFCEAGRIQAQTKPQSRLCTLLERIITEVRAPRGGAFHPKIWVLRYRSIDLGGPTHMRLIVLSRNLTRDRSWDLSLCLDGVLGRGRRAANCPLVDFLQRLPSLSLGTPPPHVSPLVAELADDLRHADWTLPAPFEGLSFAVNGLSRTVWQPSSCNRLGIVSPFCDPTALETLAGLARRENPLLVGRTEELAALPPEALSRFSAVSVMDELAETEDGEGEEADEEAGLPLSGLHAKAFVQEIGWDTAITIGSGNATSPALITGRNVEVFATLTGKRARVGGVEEIFGPDGFGRVLRPFLPAEIPMVDAELRAAEVRVDGARRDLAGAGLRLRCAPLQDPLQRFRDQTRSLPKSTEAERLVVQRVGQDLFRDALMRFWEGRCPITGITDPALLRASHMKAWAVCESDAERLDAYNGLLLSALWDAAFDRHLLTFREDGWPEFSTRLSADARARLERDVTEPLHLSEQHIGYLQEHRKAIVAAGE